MCTRIYSYSLTHTNTHTHTDAAAHAYFQANPHKLPSPKEGQTASDPLKSAIRLIEIEGVEHNMCCGTHLQDTSQVRIYCVVYITCLYTDAVCVCVCVCMCVFVASLCVQASFVKHPVSDATAHTWVCAHETVAPNSCNIQGRDFVLLLLHSASGRSMKCGSGIETSHITPLLPYYALFHTHTHTHTHTHSHVYAAATHRADQG
jgi:hypothetical protein